MASQQHLGMRLAQQAGWSGNETSPAGRMVWERDKPSRQDGLGMRLAQQAGWSGNETSPAGLGMRLALTYIEFEELPQKQLFP